MTSKPEAAALNSSVEKRQLIAKIEKLLEAAGVVTPWPTIERDLWRLGTPAARALCYRIERAIAHAFEEGVLRGARGDDEITARPKISEPSAPATVPSPIVVVPAPPRVSIQDAVVVEDDGDGSLTEA